LQYKFYTWILIRFISIFIIWILIHMPLKKFLHIVTWPTLMIALNFRWPTRPPLQLCSKIVTHPPFFPAHPPFYFMTSPLYKFKKKVTKRIKIRVGLTLPLTLSLLRLEVRVGGWVGVSSSILAIIIKIRQMVNWWLSLK
jgi:hypothetical protein